MKSRVSVNSQAEGVNHRQFSGNPCAFGKFRSRPGQAAIYRNLFGRKHARTRTRDAELPTTPLNKIPNQKQSRAAQQPTELGRDIASLQRWPLVPRIPVF